jgi:hypothetical protein
MKKTDSLFITFILNNKIASDKIHLELIDYIKRISSNATNTAWILLDEGKIKIMPERKHLTSC